MTTDFVVGKVFENVADYDVSYQDNSENIDILFKR